MVTKTALIRRISAIEERQADTVKAPSGALPQIVDERDLNSPEAALLRANGYAVMTFEQCAETMV